MKASSEGLRNPPVWLLVLITISGTLAMHMFVPALPIAARSLGAGIPEMQTTISIYIVGLALGQLVYGPLSDAVGRRPMLLVGLTIYTLAGIAAMCAFSVHELIVARLAQALGGCAGFALGRAMVRDSARSEDAVKKLALLNLMMMIGPGLAPTIGAFLSSLFGWRAIFACLALLGAVTLFFTWKILPETSTPSGRFNARKLLYDYRGLVSTPAFLGFAIGGACTTTSFYAFIASAPFIINGELHRPLGEVGLDLGILIIGMGVGNALTGRLTRYFAMERLMLLGNMFSMASATILLGLVLSRSLSATTVVALMCVYCLGAGMSSPASLTRAISVNPKMVGSAAGLYGFTQMAFGALCTALAGIGTRTSLSVAVILFVASYLGQLAYWMALRKSASDRPQAA